MIGPWATDGIWLRCGLHTHSTRSDGELAPKDLAGHYARADYDVLAITDHWRITGDDSVDGITVIPSVELNCILPGARDGHVLGYDVGAGEDELHGLAKEHATLADTADWIEAHGGVSFLAHPYWTGVTAGTLELPDNVAGIEVFNAGCELEVGRGLSSVHWDELLETGRSCPALVTDDSHHPGFDSGHAWTWVRAQRSQESVLEALRTGRFYGSTGPVIHDVDARDSEVVVRCTPARSVTLLTGRTSGTAVNAGRLGYSHGADVLETTPDDLIVGARLDRPETAPFARVEVVDAWGRKAWTNPL